MIISFQKLKLEKIQTSLIRDFWISKKTRDGATKQPHPKNVLFFVYKSRFVSIMDSSTRDLHSDLIEKKEKDRASALFFCARVTQ